MLKKAKFLLAASLWLLLIAIASLISASYLPRVEVEVTFADKLVHASFYMVATVLLYLHFRKQEFSSLLFKIGAFCFVYGMIIEVLQYALPYNRGFEWADMIANGIGILLAIVLIKLVLDPVFRGKGKF